jgi:hypothetical protein
MIAVLALHAGAAVARGTIVHAGGAWAAMDFGAVCEARGRSVLQVARGKPQARAGFSFSADRRRWGEFHAQLSRVPRPGSSILLTIGRQPFMLVGRGDQAWSRGAAQEQAMIAAARAADSMRIEARDQSGQRFRDTYSLAGAPTAIDAAAARCAGKITRR